MSDNENSDGNVAAGGARDASSADPSAWKKWLPLVVLGIAAGGGIGITGWFFVANSDGNGPPGGPVYWFLAIIFLVVLGALTSLLGDKLAAFLKNSEKVGGIGKFIFLGVLAGVSSITTFMGLQDLLADGLISSPQGALILAIGLATCLFAIIIYVWHLIDKMVREGDIVFAIPLLAVWCVGLFVASTWWSAVGISGGKAARAELMNVEKVWRNQVDTVFAARTDQVTTAIDVAGTAAAVVTDFGSQEAGGVFSGKAGRGPVYRCFTQMGSAVGSLQKTLRQKSRELSRAHKRVNGEIDALAEKARVLSTTDLVAAYRTGGSKIQSALASEGSVGNLNKSVSAAKSLATCPAEARTNERAAEAIAQVEEKLAELSFTDDVAEQDFILPEPKPSYFAVFTHFFGLALPGWGIAIVFDYLPLALLWIALAAYRRKKLGLKLIDEQIEEKELELAQMIFAKEAQIDALEARIAERGQFDPELRERLNADLAEARQEHAVLARSFRELQPVANNATFLSAQVQNLGEVNASLNQRAIDAEVKADTIHAEKSVLEARVRAAETSLARTQSENAELKSQLQVANTAFGELQRERDADRTVLARTKQLLANVALGFKKLSDKHVQAIADKEGAEIRLDSVQTELDAYKRKHGALVDNLREKEHLVGAYRGQHPGPVNGETVETPSDATVQDLELPSDVAEAAQAAAALAAGAEGHAVDLRESSASGFDAAATAVTEHPHPALLDADTPTSDDA